MKITLFYKSGGLLTRKAGALKLYVVPWGKQVSDLMWKKLPDSIRAKTISRQRHLTISKTKKETTCQLWKYVEKKYEKKRIIWDEAEQKCYLKLLRYNRTLVCKHHSPLKEIKSAYWRCWFLVRERKNETGSSCTRKARLCPRRTWDVKRIPIQGFSTRQIWNNFSSKMGNHNNRL